MENNSRSDEICYATNFLTDVIVRVDLLNPVNKLAKTMPKEISDVIKPHFPIAEPREIVAKGLKISQKLNHVLSGPDL